ncbi:unnamed protein product [Prunus armeniaca]|uniref:Uncharacterized protein n=1 Tax=Prunus armeniaca TaxID=36596 RepID=A0A6J5W3T8_PRUAR|nr:unnamed protein product [Prunus armeniaca]CAB4294364.1 unnamed protein product [Prunus armeniaca]
MKKVDPTTITWWNAWVGLKLRPKGEFLACKEGDERRGTSEAGEMERGSGAMTGWAKMEAKIRWKI